MVDGDADGVGVLWVYDDVVVVSADVGSGGGDVEGVE